MKLKNGDWWEINEKLRKWSGKIFLEFFTLANEYHIVKRMDPMRESAACQRKLRITKTMYDIVCDDNVPLRTYT